MQWKTLSNVHWFIFSRSSDSLMYHVFTFPCTYSHYLRSSICTCIEHSPWAALSNDYIVTLIYYEFQACVRSHTYIIQMVHLTEGNMVVYGPVCHPQNIIWGWQTIINMDWKMSSLWGCNFKYSYSNCLLYLYMMTDSEDGFKYPFEGTHIEAEFIDTNLIVVHDTSKHGYVF